MNVSELCFHLRHRRRMYLLDDRFATAVAFVEGYNAAFDGVPLAGFRDYVADRIFGHGSTVHWSYLIASTKVAGILEGEISLDRVPADCEAGLTDVLVDLLERYQEKVREPQPSTA
ncbi:hypothetical protein AB0M02_06970 [Actinoplanes sp. NPDC051861]|uniref:hypothetical protein n=1 Tax=Actinoplanes sp. NPDC051861 TaxID=3155170 RepID=UPI00341BBA38